MLKDKNLSKICLVLAGYVILNKHVSKLVTVGDGCPLSSDRPHLSYSVCLEVRGEIIRTVLCCAVYDSCAQS